ncbi:MAG: hypothetical protein Q8M55_05645 [Actinomycetota bacterium]|nr:hypothetical protein [Actinomycetota bacterium]MDZ4179854.1 hypothetical protein [Coriobacteriia bacterium]
MVEFTRDEALAFIESLRLIIGDRTGFKWLAEKLSRLTRYVESIAAENERLNEFIDLSGVRTDYESYRATTPDGD